MLSITIIVLIAFVILLWSFHMCHFRVAVASESNCFLICMLHFSVVYCFPDSVSRKLKLSLVPDCLKLPPEIYFRFKNHMCSKCNAILMVFSGIL